MIEEYSLISSERQILLNPGWFGGRDNTGAQGIFTARSNEAVGSKDKQDGDLFFGGLNPSITFVGDAAYYWRVRFSETDGLERLWSETGAFTATSGARGDGDGNGLPDHQELSGDETGAFNPEPETGWQDALTYLVFETGDGAAAQAALRLSDDGSSLSFFRQTAEIREEGPAALDMGLFSLRLHVPEAGDATLVRLYFAPSPLDEDSRVYKYDTATEWFEYTGYAEPGDDLFVLTIELVDGGYGDADGVANGVIVDPLGTSTTAGDTGDTDSGASSSGGGGVLY